MPSLTMQDTDRVNLAMQRTFTSLNNRVQRSRYTLLTKEEIDILSIPQSDITLIRIRRKIMIRDRKLRKRQSVEEALSKLMDENHDIYAQAEVLYTIYYSVESLETDINNIKDDIKKLQSIFDEISAGLSFIRLSFIGVIARIYFTLYPNEAK